MCRRICISLLVLALNAGPSLAQESVINTVERVKKSIVHIRALQTNLARAPKASAAIDPRTGRMVISRRVRAGVKEQRGAGVIIDPQGLIVTNFHTIYLADAIQVKLFDGTIVPATILRLMSGYDLALLRIQPPFALFPIEFANSDAATLNTEIIHVGNSDLLNETISGGRIIGLGVTTNQETNTAKQIEMLQVNINIYKGDSGGPLLNRAGQLIGMTNAKMQGTDRKALAIPSNKIRKLYLEFMSTL